MTNISESVPTAHLFLADGANKCEHVWRSYEKKPHMYSVQQKSHGLHLMLQEYMVVPCCRPHTGCCGGFILHVEAAACCGPSCIH